MRRLFPLLLAFLIGSSAGYVLSATKRPRSDLQPSKITSVRVREPHNQSMVKLKVVGLLDQDNHIASDDAGFEDKYSVALGGYGRPVSLICERD